MEEWEKYSITSDSENFVEEFNALKSKLTLPTRKVLNKIFVTLIAQFGYDQAVEMMVKKTVHELINKYGGNSPGIIDEGNVEGIKYYFYNSGS